MLFLHIRQILVLFSRSLGPYDYVMWSYQGGSLLCDPPPLGFGHVDSSMFKPTVYIHSAVLCTQVIDREPCENPFIVMDMYVF
jgi:hypothetical protein